jgi:hypothetical protein
MTEKYFISTSPRIGGSHTVHRLQCPFLPEPGRRVFLGFFQSPRVAVRAGRSYFRRADGCPFCFKAVNEMKKPVYTEIKTGMDLVSSSGMKKASCMNLMFCSLS